MAKGTTFWQDTNVHSLVDTTITEPLIDNSTYNYFFELWLSEPMSGMIFFGARIEYTYTEN